MSTERHRRCVWPEHYVEDAHGSRTLRVLRAFDRADAQLRWILTNFLEVILRPFVLRERRRMSTQCVSGTEVAGHDG